MSRKEIESKVSKYLRKANRRKSTPSKLEKINELIEILRAISPHIPSGKGFSTSPKGEEETWENTLEMYIELCYLHKMKFQMDALFDGVKQEMTLLNQDASQIDQAVFLKLVQRLQTVLDIDAYHPEAQTLLDSLLAEYPQHAQHLDYSGLYLDISPYQRSTLRIEIACNVTDIMKNATLQLLYEPYQVVPHKFDVPEKDSSPEICCLRFFQNQLSTFETFHEALRTKPTYSITVNKQTIDEKSFSAWFQCYKGFLKAKTTQYCYGGSPFTFNFFGCHKLFMKDIAKHFEKSWFHYGTLDENSGLFLVDAEQIAQQIRSHLPHCGFCPALTQEKLLLGIALIPNFINPEYGTCWNYFYTNGKKSGIIPSGNDIAISIQDNNSVHAGHSPSTPLRTGTLIEVGVTPYIEKILRYLGSDDISELSEIGYKSLSHCMECGAAYKPHTMTCSKCKTDFHKYALKELEPVLAHLRYTKTIVLPSVQQMTADSKQRFRSNRLLMQQKTVSFSQLWNDPEVRKILSKKRAASEENRESDQEEQKSSDTKNNVSVPEPSSPVSPPTASETNFSPRFDLHEKLRHLISKKYRERKAIEQAFSQTKAPTPPPSEASVESSPDALPEVDQHPEKNTQLEAMPQAPLSHQERSLDSSKLKNEELLDALRRLKPRQRSELSKRGVVRVIYHATLDKETCPLCNYLDGMVMDPDDPATDIFSPPLYPGCTCSREYILKTEKPSNWPNVTFQFPPEELLLYLEK